ncbi:hypothetical protein [Pantoea dispersa]|uniref:hypothetical protein n=1 Tax=Pantoea dispersa TaxID=59814 RepID=UPI001BA5265A|nr:hypothetical protein [Pantoea dispersa]MBS0900147.1 hypothetical protein [Pantoea dispersa]
MSGKSGFDADDLSITLARFASKRRNIVYDEAKLKRKAPEPVVFSSATHDCGGTILKSVAINATNSDKTQDEYKSSLKYSWEKEGFFVSVK